MIAESQQVYVNTANSDISDPLKRTSVLVTLDKPIDTSKYNVFCSIIDSQIPNSIYTSDGTQNITFTINYMTPGNLTVLSSSETFTTTIPAGNYSGNQAALATVMTRAITLGSATTSNVNINFSYQPAAYNVLPRFTVHTTGTGVVSGSFQITKPNIRNEFY